MMRQPRLRTIMISNGAALAWWPAALPPFAKLNISTAFWIDHPFTASLNCFSYTGGTDQSWVFANVVRINALAVDNIQSQ
jgi:hypothetical protein